MRNNNVLFSVSNKNPMAAGDKVAVGIDDLMELLSLGKNCAGKIGEEAGAVIRVGRRKLYNVKRIQEYMDSITEGNA